MQEIAPSDGLRKWFAHKKERWQDFKNLYLQELRDRKDLLKELKALLKNKTVTLLYAAKDKERNNAKAILEFIKRK